MTEPKRGGARPGASKSATGRNIEYITLTLPKKLTQKKLEKKLRKKESHLAHILLNHCHDLKIWQKKNQILIKKIKEAIYEMLYLKMESREKSFYKRTIFGVSR